MKNRNSFLVQAGKLGGLTLASSALGFARELLIAHQFGASHLTDSYLVALAVPTLIYGFLFGSALNVSVIPRLSALLDTDPKHGHRVFAQFLSGAAVLSVLVSLLIFLFPKAFVAAIAPGLAASATTTIFARTLSPLLFLLVTSFAIGSFHCAQHRAAHWGLIGVVQNAIIVGSLVSVSRIWGIQSLLIATLAGGLAALLVQMRVAQKDGFHEGWANPLVPGAGRQILANMLPFALVLGVGGDGGTSFVDIYLIRFFASTLPAGTISLLALGNKLMALPVLFIGAALGLALLPSLSIAIANHDRELVNDKLLKALSYALALVSPIFVLYVDLGRSLVATVFSFTALTPNQISQLGDILMAYAGTVVGLVFAFLLNSILAATKRTKALIGAGAASILCNAALMYLLRGPFGARGIAMAVTIGSFAYTAILALLLREHWNRSLGVAFWRPAAIIIIGSVLMHFAIRLTLSWSTAQPVVWLGSIVWPLIVGSAFYGFWLSLNRKQLRIA